MTTGTVNLNSKTNKKGKTTKRIELFYIDFKGQYRSLKFEAIAPDQIAAALREKIKATATGTLQVEFEEDRDSILKLREAGQPWENADFVALLSRTQPTDSQISITKRQGRNQYYDEDLAKGLLPLRMMLIPAGIFIMGSPRYELERRDNEGPQQEVTLSHFFMAKYPITQTQWRVVANLPQVKRQLNPEPSWFKGKMHPVEQVSWYEALEFCDRLTVYTNRQYRLPTEAEWEYACRANTVTPFHFGDTVSTDYANYNGANEEYGAYYPGSRGEDRGKTTPVDQFEGANAFGLCDMHGNVWEWCQDYWHKNYDDAPTNGIAWLEDGTSSLRILRGGSWIDSPHNCRSASRKSDTPDRRGYSFGFRVCCSASRAQMLSGVSVSADSASFKVPNPESYNLPTIE